MQLLRRRTPAGSDSPTTPPYPVSVPPRDVAAEAAPNRVEGFETREAVDINRARLDHLAWMRLPLDGRSVLDVGGGVGHLAQFFVERGCRVVSCDARPENVQRLRELYPGHEAHVMDVESDGVRDLGQFDIVFCYGLLYHLESPIRALRNFESVCRDLLLVETMICDSSLPVLRLDDETLSFNQALRGIGSRPSPSFVSMALNRVGFRYVYAPSESPRHPDYDFNWRDDLAVWRDDCPLRCVFIASRGPLDNDRLVPLVAS